MLICLLRYEWRHRRHNVLSLLEQVQKVNGVYLNTIKSRQVYLLSWRHAYVMTPAVVSVATIIIRDQLHLHLYSYLYKKVCEIHLWESVWDISVRKCVRYICERVCEIHLWGSVWDTSVRECVRYICERVCEIHLWESVWDIWARLRTIPSYIVFQFNEKKHRVKYTKYIKRSITHC